MKTSATADTTATTTRTRNTPPRTPRDMEPPGPRRRFRRRDAAERQAGPVLGTLAVLGYKLRRAMLAGEARAVEDEVEEGPEMPADRAASTTREAFPRSG